MLFGMAEYLILLLVTLIAFFGGGWWAILLGAMGLSMSACHALWVVWQHHPHVPLDRNILMHFLRSWVVSLAACSGAYIMGTIWREAL
jgi:hypothetical protein